MSKENYERLDTDTLYRTSYNEQVDGYIFGGSIYHCRNWTFRCRKYADEQGFRAYMCDTYFGDKTIAVTDENIERFKVVFRRSDVDKISEQDTNYYRDEDICSIAIDSSGKPKHFVTKGTKKSKEKVEAYLQGKVDSAQHALNWAIEDLKNFIDGEHYLCNDCV